MCGITGFFSSKNHLSKDEKASLIQKMTSALVHRGPDSHGYWNSSQEEVFLGHRRLAIIDTSSAGHQPMTSKSERYVLTYNGEIYNHLDLREKINRAQKTSSWVGHSDTETILAGFDLWGIENTIEKLNGMFAIAVWDKEKQELLLARDRAGEKPLYYGLQKNSFIFASELKSLKQYTTFEFQINREALRLYFSYNYIPTPHSIYQGVHKLAPGHLLRFNPKTESYQISQYWSPENFILSNNKNERPPHDLTELDSLIEKSIARSLISDVPIGCFLSGGIDSSLVVAKAQALAGRKLDTFTIGFTDPHFNEAPYARRISDYLKTQHHELILSANDVRDQIENLAAVYDEPFSDSSQIPTYLVSRLASKHVKVSLSGDAGDELFGGYNRYLFAHRYWPTLSKIPFSLRKGLAGGLSLFSTQFASKITQKPSQLVQKGISALRSESLEELYDQMTTREQPRFEGMGQNEIILERTNQRKKFKTPDAIENMMYLDFVGYLPDDILVKVDRAAMACSLETRVPFLDKELVEYALQLPLSFKIRHGQSKWALRQILSKHIPLEFFNRPKMGFGIPLGSWLRGPLKEWAHSLLVDHNSIVDDFYDVNRVLKMWEEHQSQKRDWSMQLWDILMLNAWVQKQR